MYTLLISHPSVELATACYYEGSGECGARSQNVGRQPAKRKTAWKLMWQRQRVPPHPPKTMLLSRSVKQARKPTKKTTMFLGGSGGTEDGLKNVSAPKRNQNSLTRISSFLLRGWFAFQATWSSTRRSYRSSLISRAVV